MRFMKMNVLVEAKLIPTATILTRAPGIWKMALVHLVEPGIYSLDIANKGCKYRGFGILFTVGELFCLRWLAL